MLQAPHHCKELVPHSALLLVVSIQVYQQFVRILTTHKGSDKLMPHGHKDLETETKLQWHSQFSPLKAHHNSSG